MENVFYFKKINSVGGVESFLYYLAKKYNFSFYYKEGDPEQIKRLAKLIKVRKYKEPIKCDNFFCNYGLDIEVEAKNKYHIAHCDYKEMWFSPILYDDFKYIGVSKLVCDSFKELTGKDIELIYNPLYIEKKPTRKKKGKKLQLISATRLTREKGLKRMQKLGYMLDKAGIDYEWKVYTNRVRGAIGAKVTYLPTKLDILEEIANSDFLIQLSDSEAYCYSVVEALEIGTPVIVTDLPVYKELGLNEDNAIICNINMTNFDINQLNKTFNFKYEVPKEEWKKYLSTKKEYDPNEKVKVKILKSYFDIETQQKEKRYDIKEMEQARASYLESKGLVEIL